MDHLDGDCCRYMLHLMPCASRLALASVSAPWNALVWEQEILGLKIIGLPHHAPRQIEYCFDRVADAITCSIFLPARREFAATVMLGQAVADALDQRHFVSGRFLNVEVSMAWHCELLSRANGRLLPGIRGLVTNAVQPELLTALRPPVLTFQHWDLERDPLQTRVPLDGVIDLTIGSQQHREYEPWMGEDEEEDEEEGLAAMLASLPLGLRRLQCELQYDDYGESLHIPDTPRVRKAWVRVAPTVEHIVMHGGRMMDDVLLFTHCASLLPALRLGFRALRVLHLPGGAPSDESAMLYLIHSAARASLDVLSAALPSLVSIGALHVGTGEGRHAPAYITDARLQSEYVQDVQGLAALGLRGLRYPCRGARPLPRLRELYVRCHHEYDDGRLLLAAMTEAWLRHLPHVSHVNVEYHSWGLMRGADVARALAPLQSLCLPGFEATRRTVQLLLRPHCDGCGFSGLDGEPLGEQDATQLFRRALPGLGVRVRYRDADRAPAWTTTPDAVSERPAGDVAAWSRAPWPIAACVQTPCPELRYGERGWGMQDLASPPPSGFVSVSKV